MRPYGVRTSEAQIKKDHELFKRVLEDFDKSFVQKNKTAMYKSLAPDFEKLIENGVVYEDDEVTINIKRVTEWMPHNDHDRQLYADVANFLYERFQQEPASQRTLHKFKFIFEKLLRICEFV